MSHGHNQRGQCILFSVVFTSSPPSPCIAHVPLILSAQGPSDNFSTLIIAVFCMLACPRILFADRNKICPDSGGGQNILLGLQGTYIRTLFEAHVQMPPTAL